MGLIITDSVNYDAIAEAIRTKSGTLDTFKPNEMAPAILSIPSGGGGDISVESLTATENKVYTAPTGKAYSPVTVSVPTPAGYADVTGTTASATEVQNGKVFVNASGVETTGTAALKWGVVRPDAELIGTKTYDAYWIEDEELTWPGYTTTSTTLKAATDMTPTISLDLANYHYYVVERALTIPTYSIDTIAKGRVEYQVCSTLYEIISIPGNTFQTLDGSKKYATRVTTIYTAGSCVKLLYWSSGTAFASYNSAAYGVATTMTAPSLSSTSSATPNLTIKIPALLTRGSTTYFVNTFMNAVTDVRTQFIADIYRVPIESDWGLSGWGVKTQMDHIVSCINTSNHKLT